MASSVLSKQLARRASALGRQGTLTAWGVAGPVLVLGSVLTSLCWGQVNGPPSPETFPALQVVPEPYGQASFMFVPLRQELCRFHFGSGLQRPFLYPVNSPNGWPLTRMGHPHDPVTHSHHNSVWISHADVNGFDFWGDHPQTQIVCTRVTEYNESAGDFLRARLVAELEWHAEGRPLLKERRHIEVRIPVDSSLAWRSPRDALADGYFIVIESRFVPVKQTVTFGDTAFGLIGVRMAKTIGVRDGGGRILNSDGLVNEKEVFRKPAKWVDYSGYVAPGVACGITLFDHPQNEGFPHPFHVRDDGWMGICFSFQRPVSLFPEGSCTVKYGLWCHGEVPDRQTIERRWESFAMWVGPEGGKP
ncbi:MAG: hypothetical protein KatS3mg109_0354 [Pirellulaceae bacterium]|nr:MAG: hypothetical protein KatS3mg109_0354 [Pirellulaceae bacterium]